MVTIKDVARAADVSPMTASRVVNNTGNVNPAARERVLEAVAALGYIRNATASSLRSPGSPPWTVGLILSDVGNPFSAELHRAVEDVARQNGSLVLTASTDESLARMAGLVEEFWSRQVDGIILAPPPGRQDYLESSIRRGAPIVLVDRPAIDVPLPCVMSDGRSGIITAVQHLVAHGHRRIAYIGDTRSPSMRLRFEGYVEAMLQAGLDVLPELSRTDITTVEEARSALTTLLASPQVPTAVVTARNTVTIGAVRALHRAGRQHEVALVGFDDLDLAPDLDPALTVVAQDPRGMGTVAATMLFDRLSGSPAVTRGTQMTTTLIPRGSGEIPGPHR